MLNLNLYCPIDFQGNWKEKRKKSRSFLKGKKNPKKLSKPTTLTSLSILMLDTHMFKSLISEGNNPSLFGLPFYYYGKGWPSLVHPSFKYRYSLPTILYMQILDNHFWWKSTVECIGRKEETFVIKMGIYFLFYQQIQRSPLFKLVPSYDRWSLWKFYGGMNNGIYALS
jgi:hypothetical protein